MGHKSSVLSVAISPNGKFIASGGKDKTIKLWDLLTGKLKHTFSGHTHEVRCVVFSPDGSTLASGSWDETVKLWNVETGNVKQTFVINNNLYKKFLNSLELVLDVEFEVKRTDCYNEPRNLDQ